ncbi:MAG: hypothetical protein AABY83_05135 [Pseudomonadota bacterium]
MNKYRLLTALVLTTLTGVVPAAGTDSMTKATKSMELRRYDEAWRELYSNIGTIDASARDAAMFTLASIFHNNAILYKQFYLGAVEAQTDYLNLLLKDKSKNKSKYAPLAAAMLAYEKGDCKSALAALSKMGGNQEKSITSLSGVIDTACRSGRLIKANDLFAKGTATLDATLAAARISYSNGRQKQVVDATLNRAAITPDKVLKDASASGVADYIILLAEQGKIEEALKFVTRIDLSKPWLKEESKDGRKIYFYTPASLSSLSSLYSAAFKFYVAKLSGGGKYNALGSYLSGERSFLEGDYAGAAKILDGIVGKGKLPPRVDERGAVLLKFSRLKTPTGGDVDSAAIELASASADKLELLSDIAWGCSIVGGKCEKFMQLASSKVDVADSKRGKALFSELGKLFELTNKHGKAIALLEMARDKANKNKIEYNDPLMLTSLAEAYRSTKSFSEHLEIYFEMSKYYPAVRIVQDAVQGIYSVEQKSAGDVKIF